MKSEKVRPMLRWPGGKTRMLKHLLPMIPEHVCYVEPFCGGAAMLLAKSRSKVEVINDINGDLVALYLSTQRHLPEMIRQIDQVVASRELFHLFTEQRGLTEIERAMRFLIRNRISFGGNMNSFGVAKTAGGGVAFSRKSNLDLIKAVHERLDRVVIENIPYDRCFQNYDSADTFFFMDPPYLNSRIKAYDGWDEKQMKQFASSVGKLRGKWIVTLDGSDFNRSLFADYKIQTVTTQNGAVNHKGAGGKQTFSEIIITPK